MGGNNVSFSFILVLQGLMASQKGGSECQRLGDNCQILAVRSDICKIGQLSDRTTVRSDNCQIGQLSDQTTVRSDNCQWDNCQWAMDNCQKKLSVL